MSNPGFLMPLGTVVHDKDGQPWVYYGYTATRAGTGKHRFIKAMKDKWAPAPYDYAAVKVETILKKFPDAAEHIQRPYMIIC